VSSHELTGGFSIRESGLEVTCLATRKPAEGDAWRGDNKKGNEK
jgi:hypothetical protein